MELTIRPPARAVQAPVSGAATLGEPWWCPAAARLTGGLLLVIWFFVAGPKLLPYQTTVVLSGSMEPSIQTGAVAFLLPVRGWDVGVGDVILFQRPDAGDIQMLHRVVGVEQEAGRRYYLTRGDANSAPDPWRVQATETGWRMAFAVPFVGYALRALQSPAGRVLLVGLPVVGLTLLMLMDTWRPRRPERT
jgi:signal peptidase